MFSILVVELSYVNTYIIQFIRGGDFSGGFPSPHIHNHYPKKGDFSKIENNVRLIIQGILVIIVLVAGIDLVCLSVCALGGGGLFPRQPKTFLSVAALWVKRIHTN